MGSLAVSSPPGMSVSSTARIAILGAGAVGSAIAFSLVWDSVASEILLVDPMESMRDAQVGDISDGSFGGAGGGSVKIRAGTPQEAGQCDIVVFTAGARQRPGETRTDLLSRNLAILRSAIDTMKPFRGDTIFLMVANPVDVLTYFAQQYSGLPKNQVIGTGTYLDSSRLRGVLAERIGVDASSVDAYVLGEHGESQMVAWSCVTVGAVRLQDFLPGCTMDDYAAIAQLTRNKAHQIIEAKGATAYGIGACTASLCKSILFDQNNVRPISHWNEELNCCLSLPSIIGRKGFVKNLRMPLNGDEEILLGKSAETLRMYIKMGKADGN